MALAAGTRLGPYEVIAPLGAGGMGEVYRARDSRLRRDVAIKVLPPRLSLDPDHLRRFEHEARAASALNHPNLLTVFDVGSREGAPYLVTELLEGNSLREILRQAMLPVAKAEDHALQIARGLAAAHDKGIVHRDLKPENLFVTTDARVKILDFGLARLVRLAPSDGGASEAPTDTRAHRTAAGAVLGTVGYMAPEQVRGEDADARADVFAFGAVLYEMLSGRRAFARETAAETMTAILHDEPPPLVELRAEVPQALLRVLERCLAKRPEARFGSGRETLFALEVAGAAPRAPSGVAAATLQGKPGPGPRLRHWLTAIGIGAALAAVGALALRPRSAGPARRDPVVASLILPELTGSLVRRSGAPDIALSPDGTRLAYLGVGQDRRPTLFVRRLDSSSVRELPGTTNALSPFWSPEGDQLGFFADGKLRKVPEGGGASQTICDTTAQRSFVSGSWSRKGVILFSDGHSLFRVSAAGGAPQRVLAPAGPGELLLRWPSFLPDGRRFLYFAQPATGSSRVYVRALDGSEPSSLVLEGRSRVVFSSSGHLVFVQGGVLVAQPVDQVSLRPLGEPKPLATRVASHAPTGRGGFSVSERGRMAYVESSGIVTELVWKDREGRTLERLAHGARHLGAVLAPDGRRVAVEIEDGETSEHVVWVLGPGRGVRSRLTRPPGDSHHPVWSPDGREIAYSSSRTGKWLGYRRRSDGLGEDELLHDGPDLLAFYPRDWARDGGAVLVNATERDGRERVWLVPRSGEARPLVDGHHGALSPSGRWLAVSSADTGRSQVYVFPFPALDTRWQVSTEGGAWPLWRSDGRELYYVSEDRTLMSVRVAAGDAFEAAAPATLFPLTLRHIDLEPNAPGEYSPAAGGDRFVICQVQDEIASPSITVVTDWEGLIRER